MAVLVKEIVTELEESTDAAIERARKLLGVDAGEVQNAYLAKTSLDARRRDRVRFVHSVSFVLEDEQAAIARHSGNRQISLVEPPPLAYARGSRPLASRPVIAGFGPAGMFAGLLLAREGYRPLIFERGAPVEKRAALVERFWQTGELCPDTNVQFGEGGAGTFSDGKLTTRIGDPKSGWVLDELVRFGAPPEILHKAKPHVGTDRLRQIVKAMREEILRLGGEICFETPITGLCMKNQKLRAVKTKQGEHSAELLVLATGHSARDTFLMLEQQGFLLEAKPFSVGVRIEHPQAHIDRGLYGGLAGHPALPPGEYQLSHRQGERGVYTFCMCPGGVVVPSSSEPEMVVTNGMSYHARDGKNANAALVVSVTPQDYGTAPLDGVRFQQRLERAAFAAGGGGYRAPAQDAASFLAGKRGLQLGHVTPSYCLGVTETNFTQLFPDFITGMLRDGLVRFGRKLPGFDCKDAILTGIETRTSSPVRILRGADLQAVGMQGVYPCAEGAGYAGGIMSAAVDGLRAAIAMIEQYAPAKSDAGRNHI